MQRSQSEAAVDKYQQDGKERTEELRKKAAEQAVNKYQEDGKKRTVQEVTKYASSTINTILSSANTTIERGKSLLKKIFGKK